MSSSSPKYHAPGQPSVHRRPKIQRYAETSAWILVSLAMVYYIDFLSRVHERLASPSMILVKKVKIDLMKLDQDHPTAIKIATMFGLLAFICYNVALWDAFHILTPVILFISGMGLLSMISLV